MSSNASNTSTPVSNFLRQIIEDDLSQGTYTSRRIDGQPDPAAIRTRFPPEPNGYLHIGHAKSICLNFGLAKDFAGVCHLRFDDTNPEKEDQEYVEAIVDAVQWLGFTWEAFGKKHLFYASDYFEQMYRFAIYLIEQGLAYVDEQSAETMRKNRGDFVTAGIDSPYRNRSVAENLARFEDMRSGALADGAAVLRAKIDMASPNINMRDPTIYRIKHASHHNTGNAWCIYPMYTFAHPCEDAIENITHSICTLEFEDQRPFYDWLLDHLADGGLIVKPRPHQYEFARLNLTYVVTSKRKLKQLVDDKHVQGWDDPRMPTIVGLRRRGYTPESLRLFAERIGVSKADSWIDYSTLEAALRDDLDAKAARAMAVLDPIALVLTNWQEVMGTSKAQEPCTAPVHPHYPERGQRQFALSSQLWIERSDFEITPPKGYHRLYPGNRVRLKYGYVIECTGYTQDDQGNVTEVQARIIPDTKSGTPGADSIKVKGVITWVSQHEAVPATVHLYDRLFTQAQPDAGGKDFLQALNIHSLQTVTAWLEPSLKDTQPEQHFQFERHGYFATDRKHHQPQQNLVFNRAVGLKDSWAKP